MAFRRSQTEVLTPRQAVTAAFHSNLDALAESMEQLHTAASNASDSPNWVLELQAAYRDTRINYKRIEFLVAHLDPQGTKDHLNGAPLPTLERHSPSLSILKPEGLQVLDELIFSDDPAAIQAEITQHTKTLKSRFKAIYIFQTATYIADRNILEAIRFELVRIFTLGLSGFDTPSSSHALPEAQAAFSSIHEAIRHYYPLLPDEQAELRKTIESNFAKGQQFLDRNRDFDSFDRLEFLRSYIHPLFGQVLDLHQASGIETIDEVVNNVQAVNYSNHDLFDEELFNPYFYAQLSPKDDRPGVRKLGHTLFFDPVLSQNLQRSCASCHHPEKGFTDGMAKSLAIDKLGTVDRNAPTIINAVFATRFFHDLRSDELANQAEHVILSDKEFNMSLGEVLDRLAQSSEYQQLFREAFPQVKNTISRFTLMTALESYVLSLNSFNSPFDRYVRGETEKIAPEIEQGFNVFMGKGACGTCHFAPTFAGLVPPDFIDSESEVLGIPTTADTVNVRLDPDLGRFSNGRDREHAAIYKHSFKTPTVRNAALTGPYMHNGVYSSLEDVVDFYNRGGGAGMGMDLPNQTLPFDELNLSREEQQALVAFMESLTDTNGLTARPDHLPVFDQQPAWNKRVIGGTY